MRRYISILVVALQIIAVQAWSKDVETPKPAANDLKLNYPELEVTPRASERIETEAKNEARSRWLTFLPFQLSALATIYAGTQSTYAADASDDVKDRYTNTKKLAVGLGAGWMVFTMTMSALYRPYFEGYKAIAKMPTTTQREELARERIAEESLYAPEPVATKLKWLSFATNLAANLALLQNANRDSNTAIAVGGMFAFAPLLFETRWTQVAQQHREYKKKIYGPIAYASPIATSENQYQPGLAFLWFF